MFIKTIKHFFQAEINHRSRAGTGYEARNRFIRFIRLVFNTRSSRRARNFVGARGSFFVLRAVSSRGKILREMGDDEDKKRLYVGSLSFNTDDDRLREVFAKIGEVSDGKRN